LSRLLKLLVCTDSPLVCLTAAEWYTEARRLTFRNIAPDLERGLAAIIEMNVPTMEPDVEDPTYSSRHFVEREENMQVPGDTLSGPSMEDRGESIDSMSMTEQLQGIGTSFENVETHDEHDLFG
jgi:hypothetical protein